MIAALQGMVRISRGVRIWHTVRAGRGESRAVQVHRESVPACNASSPRGWRGGVRTRTCPTEESRDGNHRRALSQAAGEYGAVLSMSRPGRFWGNGQCESFLKTLKQEEIDARPYHSMEQLEERVAEFIEQIYNKVRLHSSLGSWSSDEFQARLAQSGIMLRGCRQVCASAVLRRFRRRRSLPGTQL
jgi:hypothetical protein